MAKTKKAPAGNSRPAKTKCPISREDFLDKSRPVTLSIDGHNVTLDPKDFSTGSFGYFANGKVEIDVGGTPVKCQLNCVLTVIGSKDAE